MKRLVVAIAAVVGIFPFISIHASKILPIQSYNRVEHTQFHAVRPLQNYAAPLRAKAVASEGGVELVGANLNLGGLSRGVYSFNAISSTAWRPLLTDVEFNGGAIYVNGRYYAHCYDYDSNYNLTESKWLCYDAETWRLESEVDCPLTDWTYISVDRTYDASTGLVYSLSYDRTATTTQLTTTDLATGANTLVGEFSSDVAMLCIASDGKGNLFTIDTYANLYSVDATTAAATLIGNTNIFDDYETGYVQSATIDSATGKMYWAEFHTEGWSGLGALYEINTANAATVKVVDLPSKAEFVGLYIPDQGISEAPAAPTSLVAETQTLGSTNVRFSFDVPTTANNGTSLSLVETLTIEVIIDNETYDLIDGVTPGAHITTDYYSIPKGAHVVKVRAENAAGSGKNAAANFFSGFDVPAAPANLTLSRDGSTANLSWTAPTRGAEDGDIRTPITYDVVRYPDATTVAAGISATSFSETVPTPAHYYYTVTAITTDGRGPAATSNAMVIGTFTVPYLQTFNTANDAATYSTIDANNDDHSWDWYETDQCMRYRYSITNTADDWLITPGIQLDVTKSYEFSFNMRKYLSFYNENLEIYYGTSADVASMQKVADVSVPSVDNEAYSVVLPALTTGEHYFALHAVSAQNQMFIYIDDIALVEAGMADVPAAPADFSATASGDSYLDALISMTAPTTTLNGMALSEIERIDVYRGTSATPLHTFTTPTPGEHLEFVDASLKAGSYTYRAVVTNAAGTSTEVSAAMYAGIDVPKPVTNATMQVGADNIPVVSWTAPASGVNGGRMDGIVSYDVVRVANSVETSVASDITTTSFSDTEYVVTEQSYLYYVIIAKTSAGSSEQASTTGKIVGSPYVAPYYESFANKTMTTNPWFITLLSGSMGGWSIAAVEYYGDATARPQDSDGGLAVFDGYHTYAGNARLTSPCIAIGHLLKPVLSFYMYHYRGNSWNGEVGESYCNTQLQVEIAMDGGEIVEIPDALFTLYDKTNGWQLHEIDLSPYVKSDYVNISFKGINNGTENICIDNICVGANYVNNVEVVSFSGPESVVAGESATFKASVHNLGTAESSVITASLYCEGSKVTGRNIRSLAADATTEVELTATVPAVLAGKDAHWQVRLSMSGDENSLDNLSEEIVTPVANNDLAGVTNLVASTNLSDVTLAWDAPDADGVTGYNVYCESAKVNDRPVSATEYTYHVANEGIYHFAVSALYGDAESAPCPEVEVVIINNGIDNALQSLVVKARSGRVVYSGLVGTMRIFTTSGIEVACCSEPSGEILLPTGIYVAATASGKVFKLRIL